MSSAFLTRGMGYGGGDEEPWSGEIMLESEVDSPAERARLVAWLRARADVVAAEERPDGGLRC